MSILCFTFDIKYTPLPTAFSTPYNISDLFIVEPGGRGGIVVTHMKTQLLFINGVLILALVFQQ
jgi:hypothetical protein